MPVRCWLIVMCLFEFVYDFFVAQETKAYALVKSFVDALHEACPAFYLSRLQTQYLLPRARMLHAYRARAAQSSGAADFRVSKILACS